MSTTPDYGMTPVIGAALNPLGSESDADARDEPFDILADDDDATTSRRAAMDEEAANELLCDEIERFLQAARAHSATWRRDAHEDYGFVAGDQWEESDRQVLRDQLRPVITFNRIGPVIDTIAGIEVANRQEVRFLPREIGDVGVNEMLSSAADWVRDACDAEDEESDAFVDLVVCGMGWTAMRMDYDAEPDGKIMIERVDPLEMYWDPAARKHNLADARRIARVRDVSRADFEAMWPDQADTVREGGAGGEWSLLDDYEDPHIVDPQDGYRGSGAGVSRRSARSASSNISGARARLSIAWPTPRPAR